MCDSGGGGTGSYIDQFIDMAEFITDQMNYTLNVGAVINLPDDIIIPAGLEEGKDIPRITITGRLGPNSITKEESDVFYAIFNNKGPLFRDILHKTSHRNPTPAGEQVIKEELIITQDSTACNRENVIPISCMPEETTPEGEQGAASIMVLNREAFLKDLDHFSAADTELQEERLGLKLLAETYIHELCHISVPGATDRDGGPIFTDYVSNSFYKCIDDTYVETFGEHSPNYLWTDPDSSVNYDLPSGGDPTANPALRDLGIIYDGLQQTSGGLHHAIYAIDLLNSLPNGYKIIWKLP